MVLVEPGKSVPLTLPADAGGPAAGWAPHPAGVVDLAPAGDGMSCTATAVEGATKDRCTVKAVDARGFGIAYYSLEIRPRRAPPGPAAPAPAPADHVAAAE